MMIPHSTAALRTLMRQTEQTAGMSVLQHGVLVARYFDDLRVHVLEGAPLTFHWRLPAWATSPLLWQQLMPLPVIRQYQIYHDAGKPICRQQDEHGRFHFPHHAAISAALWLRMTGDPTVSRLMAMDMELHTMSAADVTAFAKEPEAATLLLTALSEIHANASMFGGIDSDSFKMKFKHLDRRGKALLNLLQTQHQGEAA